MTESKEIVDESLRRVVLPSTPWRPIFSSGFGAGFLAPLNLYNRVRLHHPLVSSKLNVLDERSATPTQSFQDSKSNFASSDGADPKLEETTASKPELAERFNEVVTAAEEKAQKQIAAVQECNGDGDGSGSQNTFNPPGISKDELAWLRAARKASLASAKPTVIPDPAKVAVDASLTVATTTTTAAAAAGSKRKRKVPTPAISRQAAARGAGKFSRSNFQVV